MTSNKVVKEVDDIGSRKKHIYSPTKIEFLDKKEGEKAQEIIPVGQDEQKRVQIPDGVEKVYWYKFGPSPMEEGNAIIAGHRDWHGELGLFSYLEKINLGETVRISYSNGSNQDFKVVSKNSYPYKEFPSRLMDTTDGDKTTLVSCTGVFIKEEKSYEKRIVVILNKKR